MESESRKIATSSHDSVKVEIIKKFSGLYIIENSNEEHRFYTLYRGVCYR